MFALYLTRDILGSKEGRVETMPRFVSFARDRCEKQMRDIIAQDKEIPYIRVTKVNDKTRIYDCGSHTLFYEITEV